LGFKRLLADADPDTAARAAVRMARATARRSNLPAATREQANNVLDVGVDELAARIRDAREGRAVVVEGLTGADGEHAATGWRYRAAGEAPVAAQRGEFGGTEPVDDDSRTAHPLPAVPVEDNILLQINDPAPEATGLVFLGADTDKREGKVIAVGPGRWDDDGDKRIPLDVSAGDVVIYSKYGGTKIAYTSDEYLILSAHDVLAVVNGVLPAPKPQGDEADRMRIQKGSISPALSQGRSKRR
jgi:chaperonin GroES